jgi:anti-sigma B factor antagonist
VAGVDANSRDVPRPFEVALEPHRDTIVVKLRGELDIASVGALDARFSEVLEAGFGRVVADLRALTFIDSSGLNSIVEMNRSTAEAEIDFALVRGPHGVHRAFELTQIEQLLQFIEPDEIDAWRS